MTETRCLQCGFTSDDADEAASHAVNHHPRRCTCGPCQVVYGTARRTFNDNERHAYEVWLEGEAA